MKKLIVLILLFISLISYSQDGISFSVLQDVKLGLGLDKAHKNTSPTLDIIANLNLEGKQYDYYYFAIQLQYEHANLHDGRFTRYSVHGIWTLEPKLINKLKMGFGLGLGIINREDDYGRGSYSGTIELSYPITKNLFIVQKNEWVRRSELPTPKLVYNNSLGLKYKI